MISLKLSLIHILKHLILGICLVSARVNLIMIYIDNLIDARGDKANTEEMCIRDRRTIVRMPKPYKEIPKLPELREKFMNCYMRILEEQAEPCLLYTSRCV